MRKKLIAILITSLLLPRLVFAGGFFEFNTIVEEIAETEAIETDEASKNQGNLPDETEPVVKFTEHKYGIGYINDQGVQLKNGWYWIDKDGDNTKQCYYFDKYGFLVTDDEIDGYRVNSEGQRLKQNSEDDEIEIKEFTLAGPGAADPFALQLFEEEKFSEKSTSSEGELFAHIYATTSYAYRLATGSSAEGIAIEHETSAQTNEGGATTAQTTQSTEEDESGVSSKGSIVTFGGDGGPGPIGEAGVYSGQSGAIIAGDANSVRSY